MAPRSATMKIQQKPFMAATSLIDGFCEVKSPCQPQPIHSWTWSGAQRRRQSPLIRTSSKDALWALKADSSQGCSRFQKGKYALDNFCSRSDLVAPRL